MPLEHSVVVPLSPAETFALITEPERLRRWNNVTARIDLRAGGDYRWNIVPGTYTVGVVREIEPGRRLVIGWGPELPAPGGPDPSTVEITLEPTPDGTLVRVVHTGLPEETEPGHAAGWEHYLDRLAVAGSTGDAGPDSWLDRLSDLGELDEQKAAEASLAVAQNVLRAVTADGLSNATPCRDFTVAQVVEHLAGSIAGIGGAAGVALTAHLTDNPEVDIADLAQPALEAWAARGTDGTIDIGVATLPAANVLGILAVELLVHGWDVAMGTGQKLAVNDDLAAYVLELSKRVVDDDLRDKVGFDPAVETAPGAEALDQLIAFTGRRPA
jgi:uncharacterized protein (TIGR03086 family)